MFMNVTVPAFISGTANTLLSRTNAISAAASKPSAMTFVTPFLKE